MQLHHCITLHQKNTKIVTELYRVAHLKVVQKLNRCQLGALSASSITSQIHRFQLGSTSRIFCNTTDYLNNATANLNNKKMFLFSTTFYGLLLSGPPCTLPNNYCTCKYHIILHSSLNTLFPKINITYYANLFGVRAQVIPTSLWTHLHSGIHRN